MAKLYNASRRRYASINMAVFFDYGLSLKAVGLLCKLLALPDEWNFTLAGLSTMTSDGVAKVRSAISELEDAGYLIRLQKRTEGGSFAEADYVVFDEKNDADEVAAEYERAGYFVLSGRKRTAKVHSGNNDPLHPKPQVGTDVQFSDNGLPDNGKTDIGKSNPINNLIININDDIPLSVSISDGSDAGSDATESLDGDIENQAPSTVSPPPPVPSGADEAASNAFDELCLSATNRNKLRSAAGRTETREAYDTLISKGYSTDEIAQTWAETQREAAADGRKPEMYPQLCAWLRSRNAKGEPVLGAEARLRRRRRLAVAANDPVAAEPQNPPANRLSGASGSQPRPANPPTAICPRCGATASRIGKPSSATYDCGGCNTAFTRPREVKGGA